MRRTVMALVLGLAVSVLGVAAPAPEAAASPSAGFSADWDGDGSADVVVDDLQGRLWLYPGNGSGGIAERSALADVHTDSCGLSKLTLPPRA